MDQSGGSSSICDRVGINIPMVIFQIRIFFLSGSVFMGGWGWKHCLALAVAAIQGRRCRLGRVSRVLD